MNDQLILVADSDPKNLQILKENLHDFLTETELVIIVNQDENICKLENMIDDNQLIIDLSRSESLIGMKNYEGICW